MQKTATTETTAIENSDNTVEGQSPVQCILKFGKQGEECSKWNGINGASC
jgi:hypothetical protein